MTSDSTRDDPASAHGRPTGSVPNPGRLVAVAVVAWVVLEFVTRSSAIVGARILLDAPFVGNALSLLLAIPATAAVVVWYARRSGSRPADWDLDWNRRIVAAGVLAGVVAYVLVGVAGLVDATLFDVEATGELLSSGLAEAVEAYPVIAVVFVLGNGIATPIAEEVVWRGIVQTELVERWGPALGIAVTAVLFALKHVAVDRSVARITALLTLALVLGLVRQRWGTGASTVTHVVVNLVASAALVALVF